MYKIVVITVQNYADAEFLTTTIGNRELFLVKVIDIQNERGIKNISDLVRKEIMVFFRLKILQKNKSENTKGLKKN